MWPAGDDTTPKIDVQKETVGGKKKATWFSFNLPQYRQSSLFQEEKHFLRLPNFFSEHGRFGL